jgi:iron complex outermembrane recepter protein
MKPENTRSRSRASNHWLAWLVASFLIASTPALAQEPRTGAAATAPAMAPTAAGAPHRLEPVIVTAPRIASEADQVPAAVSTVENRTIQQGRAAVKLNDALDRVPGVFIQNEDNFAQDMRVSIRGFGTRSAFGVRGIQILVDGLPHTLPDGQSAFDTIEPTAIRQMEVMRGPVSALYGNAAGGVLNIVTQDGPREPFVEVGAVAGDFGLWKTMLKGGGQSARINYFGALSHLQTDGYRTRSKAESTLFNSKLRYDIDDASDLTLILNAMRTPEAQDPGGLTAAQVAADPRQAAPLSLLYRTGEDISDQRIGVVYRRQLAGSRNLELAGYYNRRELDNAIPFRFIELQRNVAGARAQYDISGPLFGVAHRFFAGVDWQHQIDDRKNFDNVDGRPGATELLNQDERVTALGFFMQDEVHLTPRWSMLLGGRYDNVRFDIDDRRLIDTSDSGTRTFDQFTGRSGLMYALRPGIRLYANVAQSFETPTSTELINRPQGGGGINTDIQPQRATNYEIGMKSRVGRDFTLDAALFLIELKDELIAFRDATDRVFYRNAGESRRLGAELGLTRRLAHGLTLHMAYTFLETEFRSYRKEGVDLAGNEVPGLPRHRLFGELHYAHAGGVYAAGNVHHVGAFYVDDENRVRNSDYTLIDARLGIEKRLGRWLLDLFLGGRNLLDADYSHNVRINANGGRYFEPAPGRNYYGGVRISHRWR